LDAIEAHAKQIGIAGVAEVSAALEAKRSELGSSLTDHWAAAPIPGES
jgi:hypothetical protein